MCYEFQVLHKILPKLNSIHVPNSERIAKVQTQQQKQTWYIQEVKNKRGSEERYKVQEKGMSRR